MVVAFYNGRGTAEQYIKEGKNAVKWTRLSCTSFRARWRCRAICFEASSPGSPGCAHPSWRDADPR